MKEALKEKMRKRKEELSQRSSGGDMIFLKEGTLRVRIISQGEEEFMKEVTHFYLGKEIKGVISPDTVGEPCGILETYNNLKNSSDDDDKELAKGFSPKRKQVCLVIVYKDLKGKEIDEKRSGKLLLVPSNSLAQSIIDYYLDEDDWNDMLDWENGYDLKIKREGTGMTDTEYSLVPCSRSKVPMAVKKKYSNLKLSEELAKVIPTYEETQQKIAEYLKVDIKDLDFEETKPSKKSKGVVGKVKKPIKKIVKK